jgi:hypothetical protein
MEEGETEVPKRVLVNGRAGHDSWLWRGRDVGRWWRDWAWRGVVARSGVGARPGARRGSWRGEGRRATRGWVRGSARSAGAAS